MKNRILYSLLIVLACFGMTSCEEVTTSGKTGVTYYPEVTMAGESVVYLAANSSYTDPGATATENGVTIEIKTTSNLDITTPGEYQISYLATNVDGFSKTVNRNIVVYDGNTNNIDLSGDYLGHVIRNNDASKEFAGNAITLTATDIAPGVFKISDWIVGFYATGYGYGANYAFSGLIQINSSNEVVLLSMHNAWGAPFDSVTGTYDPATGKIAYSAKWLGKYDFVVDMVKK